jgi:PEGA domain
VKGVKKTSLGVVLLATACVPPPGSPAAVAGPERSVAGHSRVEAARELDQNGVRSFRTGRYTDAIAYFRAAYQLGGPSSELWNIVRCREGMDDVEGAASAIDDYLAAKDLLPADRADAEREAQALRARSSTLTVTTTPSGASVTVDGRVVAGATPLSTDLRTGQHTIAVRHDGYLPGTQAVEARFGRAVIVTLDLERAAK